MNSVQALIFDMDGTMIDSMPSHAESWRRFAQRHGIAMDLAELLRRTTGRTGAECIAELFRRPMGAEEAWRFAQEKEALYRELFTPIFAEVTGFKRFMGAALRGGLKIGVGTAGDKHNIGFALGRLQLDVAPHAVVGGDEDLPGKPEPHIFLETARRLGAEPRHCIVFEDAPLGIEAARRAGMRAVAICSSHRAEQLDGAHVMARARDYDELMSMKFLEPLNASYV